MKYEVISIIGKDYEPNSGAGCTPTNLKCRNLICWEIVCNPTGDNLCTNPGLGCRNGCGGAKTSSCVGTNNI